MGIYVVALTEDPSSLEATLSRAPISGSAVDELLSVRPELTLDGSRPEPQELAARLGTFWFRDEVVLYIGLAGQRRTRPVGGELSKRVREYYETRLGARGPHAGGWPLKTLSCLDELYVHYAYCGDVDRTEAACIARFAEQVSRQARASLRDPVRVMPFANLEFPKGSAKRHGIRGARAPRPKPGAAISLPAPKVPTPARPRPLPEGSVTPHHRSQNVTESDISVGQVRIPVGATKSLLPPARQDIEVVLRGRELTCRWDPHHGAKERSGVIRVGKAAATGPLAPGDVLMVSVRWGCRLSRLAAKVGILDANASAPECTEVTSVWGIHAGGPRSPFLQSGVIVLERAGIRDLRLVGEDREALKRELTVSYPEAKPATVAAWAGVLLRFAFEPAVGDPLAHPERTGQTVSLGRIESDYYWEAPDRHCRRVSWVARRIPRGQLSEGARKELSARVAFFAVRHHADELAERAAGGRPEAGPRS
jgi:hypothetical protein